MDRSQYLDARSQFVAFGLCCHSVRCGAASPARVLSPAVVAEIGREWVVRESVRLLWAEASCSSQVVAVGVSPTLGVVSRPWVVVSTGAVSAWLDRDTFLAISGDFSGYDVMSLAGATAARGSGSGSGDGPVKLGVLDFSCIEGGVCGQVVVGVSRKWVAALSKLHHTVMVWSIGAVRAAACCRDGCGDGGGKLKPTVLAYDSSWNCCESIEFCGDDCLMMALENKEGTGTVRWSVVHVGVEKSVSSGSLVWTQTVSFELGDSFTPDLQFFGTKGYILLSEHAKILEEWFYSIVDPTGNVTGLLNKPHFLDATHLFYTTKNGPGSNIEARCVHNSQPTTPLKRVRMHDYNMADKAIGGSLSMH
ncbi:hypothetical protein Pelo_6684 [Pelomyxa schiedti]|nr:hypothetical protein Pelo_6684 [Pelomyxa schiedti]